MGGVWQDLRYGLRMLAKKPGFAVAAILTLALGIGANTTIFSLVNAVLLKPLPYPHPDRLVMVWETRNSQPDNLNIVSWPNYEDWKAQSRSFERLGLFDSAGRGYNLSGAGEPEQVSGVRVTSSFFDVLRVKPLYGRTFLPEEETPGKDRVVVLSYRLWARRYGADPTLVGRTIKVDGENLTVVGVMPPQFHFQLWSGERLLWVPIGLTEGDRGRGSHSFICIARLKPGVAFEQARAEMDAVGQRLARAYPVENADEGATVTRLKDYGLRDHWKLLRALLVAVGFVLLIGCVNVANLMLARGATRQRELAIRCALGAGRFRIGRQMLTESLLLACAGGLSGLLLASWTTSLISSHLPNYLGYVPFRPLDEIALDGRVLGFTFLATLLTGVLFGLAPAFSALRTDIREALRGDGRPATQFGGNRVRHTLVAVEVALALITLAGAGLMIESIRQLLSIPPGFDPHNVLVTTLSLPQENLYYGPPVHARFCRDLEERVGSISGVVGVSAVSNLPMTGNAGRGFTIEGRPDPGPARQPGAAYNVACPGYLRTMGIPLLQGRDFTHSDALGAPDVILINAAMAQRYWPGEDPLGKRIKLGYSDSREPWLTIVGVYGSVRQWGLDADFRAEFMRPYTQAAWPSMDTAVRTATPPAGYQRPVKKALAEMVPLQPVGALQTMEDVIRDSVSVNTRRFAMLLLEAFALLALALAAVGISGVVSYSVAQRTREIGIRMALGASGSDALRLVLRGTLRWGLAGVGLGIVGAMAVTHLLEGLLYGVRPGDPFALGAAAALLVVVALLACWMPARRATRVDPMVALRYE